MDTLAHTLPRDMPLPVQRRLFTADDLERMTRQGIIAESERVELIGGEIVAMAAKGNRHEIVRNKLTFQWARRASSDIFVFGETPLRLSPREQPEPDVIVFPLALPLADVRGDNIHLVVEVADWSLGYDLGIKSLLYAYYGVREYWVIDVDKLETHIHRAPADGKYASVSKHAADEILTPIAVPTLATSLIALGFDWVDEPA